MRALKRVRHVDNHHSDLLLSLCQQTFMATQNEEISPEIGDALLVVFHRAHQDILARRDIWRRDKQQAYNKKHKIKWDSELAFSIAALFAFGFALFAAWGISQWV